MTGTSGTGPDGSARSLPPLARFLPFMDWARHYDRGTFGADFLAAVIVTIMLIPQSLAYAMLAGLPPATGLYASMLPLVAYAVFGSSRTLAVGPVAVLSLMTAATLSRLDLPTDEARLGAAALLAALSGGLLVALGLLRLGAIANLLSHPVISGFITASGILIAAGQLKHLLGIPLEGHNLPELAQSAWAHWQSIDAATAIVGAAVLAMLWGARRWLAGGLAALGLSRSLAGTVSRAAPVLAVAATILAVHFLPASLDSVRIVGSIPQGLPPLAWPTMDAELVLELLPDAALIALVGFVESVSVAQTLAAKRRQSIRPDQELFGLGAANVAAAVTGGYPVTGGFARSTVNFDAGAATPLAGAMTAIGIAATALLLTPAFHDLPRATLAATIVVAVSSLIDFKALARTWRYSLTDFAAMAATILMVLAVGVEAGIATGVALSVALHLGRTLRPHIAIVGQVPGTEHFRNVKRHEVVVSPKVLSFRVDESLYFANARFLEDWLAARIAERPEVRDVVLICSAVNMIDASALESLETVSERLGAAGVRLHLSEVKGPVMDRLRRSHFLDHLSGQVFLSQHQAMCALAPETVRQAIGSAACSEAEAEALAMPRRAGSSGQD
ncbi:SulP family inorganic anion transporter [Marinibaculum pumilum]|uniref:SulP family inorganic anion transporter n=1 Tax=Marinibaculum pumilum TaxID=1766165 RepID=A0ABV7L6Z4_9PROT